MIGTHVPTMEMHTHLLNRVSRIEKVIQNPVTTGSRIPEETTRERAASALSCSLRTVDTLIASGKLKIRREGPKGGKVLVKATSIASRLLEKGYDRDYIETHLIETLNGD